MAKPVALITGGARGIGRAIARHLLGSGWQAGLSTCRTPVDFIDGVHDLLAFS